ncbi:MAG: hypothetical protein V1889_01235 [archaeon]
MKRAQVTIFIIVGIVIVVGIIIIFLLMGKFSVESPVDLGPKAFVSKCVRDAVEESVEKILAGGGEVAPSYSLMYDGVEWNYLCYQADYYLTCYNLVPMLEARVEDEIRRDTMDDVQNCFDEMAVDFEDSGFDVSGGATDYSIDLLPGKVDINLRKNVEIVRDGAAQNFENFDTSVLSSVYDLVRVAREIVNAESQYCYFEYNGYMLLYPEYDIRRIDYDDSKIYRLIKRKTGEEFRFAVRSCAFAPGI